MVLLGGGIGFYLIMSRVFPAPMESAFADVDWVRSAFVGYAVVRLLAGIALIWLYAAARFRLRATVRSALRVGMAFWLAAYVPLAWTLHLLRIFPRSLALAFGAWGLAEVLIAAVLGGLVHQATRPEDARY